LFELIQTKKIKNRLIYNINKLERYNGVKAPIKPKHFVKLNKKGEVLKFNPLTTTERKKKEKKMKLGGTK
jgi:hypothetical protein